MTDISTGLYAFGSIVSALLYRTRSGKGQHIDCNLLSTQVASLVNIASNFLNAGQEAKRRGTAHPSIVPYQAFETSDGYIMVGAGNDGQFIELCKLIDLPHLASSSDYSTNKQRVANRDPLLQILSKRFLERSTSGWLEVLAGSGIPYGPINNMQQVFTNPQVIHNNLIQEIAHQTAGTVRVVGPAVRFSDTPAKVELPPPTLGQHTVDVMKSVLDMDDGEISRLMQNGVVK